MRQTVTLLVILIVVVLTVITGVIHGRMSNRWGPSSDTQAIAEKLEKIPAEFGQWKLQSTGTMEQSAVNMLECVGYSVRSYRNEATGEVVSVTVIIGPPGPTSVHRPEICFPSRDNKQIEDRRHVTLRDTESHESVFWLTVFQSNDVSANLLPVYYAWSTGDKWEAPDDPRFTFAGQPYLYKIQLVSTVPYGRDLKTDDPCKRFLQDFVPVLKRCMVDAKEGIGTGQED